MSKDYKTEAFDYIHHIALKAQNKCEEPIPKIIKILHNQMFHLLMAKILSPQL